MRTYGAPADVGDVVLTAAEISRLAQRDIGSPASPFFYWDLESVSPVFFQEWSSRSERLAMDGGSPMGL